jgi:hypothetical protein
MQPEGFFSPFLGQMKAVHYFKTNFFKDNFNIIPPLMPWLPKLSFHILSKIDYDQVNGDWNIQIDGTNFGLSFTNTNIK